MKLTALMFVAMFASAAPCVVTDGACVTTHADETPFEGADKEALHIQPVLKYQLTATAILDSTCTWCGHDVEWR